MRVTTRLVSALVAAGLLAVSLIALIELILAAIGRTPWLVDWRSAETFGQEHSWDDAAVRLLALVVVALGVGTIAAALRRRPPVVLPTGIDSDEVTIAVRRRSLEQMLERRLSRIDGVSSVSCRWTSSAVEVRATTTRSTSDPRRELETRARDLMRRVGVAMTEARVSVRGQGAASAQHRPPPPPPPPPPPSTVPGGPAPFDVEAADRIQPVEVPR